LKFNGARSGWIAILSIVGGQTLTRCVKDDHVAQTTGDRQSDRVSLATADGSTIPR
jgi:hypothetical protein